jgi:hypothetical protein
VASRETPGLALLHRRAVRSLQSMLSTEYREKWALFCRRGLRGQSQVKKAGRTLTVCTADAFAISDGREKVVATMLATIMAVPTKNRGAASQLLLGFAFS